eukprot:5312066-Prymnesium_polylepis.1
MAVLAGGEQRRGSSVPGLMYRSTCLEQFHDDRQVAFLACNVQRCNSIKVAVLVHLRTCLKQCRDDRVVALLTRK